MSDKIENTRNLALLAHGGAGKTSLAEALLYDAGATTAYNATRDSSGCG